MNKYYNHTTTKIESTPIFIELKTLLRKENLSHVARSIGVCRQTLYNILNNRSNTINFNTLYRLTVYFKKAE